jgi:hypothetical protein
VGVVDAEIKRAPDWRNVGRATPVAANETFHWALFTGNVEEVTRFIVFTDDTPENRAAYMAKFSPAVRARFPTPERIAAAAFFDAFPNSPRVQDPSEGFQVLDVRPGDQPGVIRTRVWYESIGGPGKEGLGSWQQTPGGWALRAHGFASDALARFNPATGEVLPRPQPALKK